MIAEVDIDGDGRIDFEGKAKCICKPYTFASHVLKYKNQHFSTYNRPSS